MRAGTIIRRWRQGLGLRSQLKDRLGRADPTPRFVGIRLSAPDHASAWGIAKQISDGEYLYPGLTPGRGDRVIDIGANIGVYALWSAHRGARVTAYEPAPETFRHLVANSGHSPLVTPVQAAIVGVPSPEREVTLFLHGERSTRNTLLGQEIGDGDPLATRVSVPAIGIDEVLDGSCDLLKIDCEGGEFDVFASVEDDRLRRAARVVLEFHRLAGEPADLLARLRGAGFDAAILEGEDPDVPFGVIGASRRGG